MDPFLIRLTIGYLAPMISEIEVEKYNFLICTLEGVNTIFFYMPQKVLLFEYNLPVLRYELSPVQLLWISVTCSAFCGDCACAHCVHCIIELAGRLTIIAYVHLASPLQTLLTYTSVEKLLGAGSIYFTWVNSAQWSFHSSVNEWHFARTT